MGKRIKKTALLAAVTTVLCAGTVSARQLHKSPGLIGVCKGPCNATVHCTGACFCYVPSGATTGSCVSDPP
jgi:hypothetical protein